MASVASRTLPHTTSSFQSQKRILGSSSSHVTILSASKKPTESLLQTSLSYKKQVETSHGLGSVTTKTNFPPPNSLPLTAQYTTVSNHISTKVRPAKRFKPLTIKEPLPIPTARPEQVPIPSPHPCYSFNLDTMGTESSTQRKNTFQNSSLGQLINTALGDNDSTSLISDQVWAGCGDEDGHRIVIALRFLLTRLYFAISVGGYNGIAQLSQSSIVSVDPRVPHILWAIGVSCQGSTREYFVLETTGEIVSANTQDIGPVRSDWATFIAQNQGLEKVSIVDKVKWTNHEEYDRGISRLWLRRLGNKDDEMAIAVKALAIRYILSSVSANRYCVSPCQHCSQPL